MIDIHTHVLPGVDDGARTIEDSFEMLRIASAGGTTDIIATPHANAQYPFDDTGVRRSFEALSARVDGSIRLHLGCEVHLDYANLQGILQRSSNYGLAGSRYVLLELPKLVSMKVALRACEELIRNELVPVMAHAERNVLMPEHLRELSKWKQRGGLIQINGQSLLGGFGRNIKQVSYELVALGLADFVASDAHDTTRRSPDLRSAYDLVCAIYGAATGNRLFVENPAAILTNSPLRPMNSASEKRSGVFRSRLSFFRSIENTQARA
ncbi:MAG TPA: CpsB/CapC family capsule biosynthesis tyrosine phosphatase [Bryobacteraceae bacterium]|jgi:protein-tyrosine phosphatase|nr:CpsB/CapC family capsule biosynthesis tyrosine phosphatase [Bryobacteraceae bacterium]